MTAVYPLWHVRADDEYKEDAKLIGIYSSESEAAAATQRLKDKSGFRDHPEGFEFERYELDKDHWEEGFISSEEAEIPDAQN